MIRRLPALLAACCLLLSAPPASAADGASAYPLAASAARDGAPLPALTDGCCSTRLPLTGEGALTLTADGPFSSAYLIFDRVPESCVLEAGAQRVELSHDGFLHAYVPLASPRTEATLRWNGDGALCEVTLLSDGEPPGWVQRWERADSDADLLVLPTHADDEHLYFGGTMPAYAAREDVSVQVAYMVNHNGEPYRPHELLDGLWTVGIRRYPVIPGFADMYSDSLEHARTIYHEQEILAYQVELLRRFRPLAVVGHDENGEYGHGAHRLNTFCLKQSVLLAADAAAFPESAKRYGAWDTPKTYLHLYVPEGGEALVMNWDVPLERFGGATAYEMAVKGFDCHASQHQYFAMEPAGIYDCRKFGLFRSTVGPDVARDDFLEHIDPIKKWRDWNGK